MRPARLWVPAWFIGSPVGLLLSGVLVRLMPAEMALVIGAAVAFAVGFGVLRALRKPAPQRS